MCAGYVTELHGECCKFTAKALDDEARTGRGSPCPVCPKEGASPWLTVYEEVKLVDFIRVDEGYFLGRAKQGQIGFENMHQAEGDNDEPKEGVAPCRVCYPVPNGEFDYDFGYLYYHEANAAGDDEVISDSIDDIPPESCTHGIPEDETHLLPGTLEICGNLGIAPLSQGCLQEESSKEMLAPKELRKAREERALTAETG